MDIAECRKKIDRYFSRDNVQPLIVDVQNRDDWNALKNHYNVGTTEFIAASKFCGEDSLPKLDVLYNEIANFTGTCFITGLTSFVKLLGETELRKVLNEILAMTIKGHIVLISYQCAKYLDNRDPRVKPRIVVVEGEAKGVTEVVLVAPQLSLPARITAVGGINNFAAAIESSTDNKLYIRTKNTKDQFPNALYMISGLSKAYDVLLQKDPKTSELSETIGTDAQWKYALDLFEKKQGWVEVIDHEFGNHLTLEIHAASFAKMKKERVWLYFVGLKLFGAKNNWCLNDAAVHSSSIREMVTNVYRGILNKSHKDKDFWECYESRKMLLNQIGNPSAELTSFCKVVVGKGKDAIYYLTDNTQQEREAIFVFLDQYGLDYQRDELVDILKHVYPTLYVYMRPFRFKNKLLDTYFQDYKYQKIINKLLPEFEKVVLEQAVKRDYNLILEPRSSKIEKLKTENALLYFMDAMGVEYLGYILEECKNLGLNAKVRVCRCELPSLTYINKEFLELWPESQIVSIKDIDEIKHHGKYDYDYYSNSKLPLHLAKELEVIHETLEKIRNKLLGNEIQNAVMIADHGASRLAVLHDTENIWEMAEKGQHSGRCCPKSEVDVQPEYATEAGDFWALANYDRFKGARKANVEVHGGATLEEICVPIIELSYGEISIEVHLMAVDASGVDFADILEIEVSFRKKAAMKMFMTAEMDDVSVSVDGKRYDAVSLGNNFYQVDMPDLKKPGKYTVTVYSGDNVIAENLPLIVKREGQRERNLL